jgi:hypothetical protein
MFMMDQTAFSALCKRTPDQGRTQQHVRHLFRTHFAAFAESIYIQVTVRHLQNVMRPFNPRNAAGCRAVTSNRLPSVIMNNML